MQPALAEGDVDHLDGERPPRWPSRHTWTIAGAGERLRRRQATAPAWHDRSLKLRSSLGAATHWSGCLPVWHGPETNRPPGGFAFGPAPVPPLSGLVYGMRPACHDEPSTRSGTGQGTRISETALAASRGVRLAASVHHADCPREGHGTGGAGARSGAARRVQPLYCWTPSHAGPTIDCWRWRRRRTFSTA